MKKITVTAQQQGEYLADIAGRLKFFETVTGYLMVDKEGKLDIIPEGRDYHYAMKNGLKEVAEIFDVEENVYFMEGASPQEFIAENSLHDVEVIFEETKK